MDQLVVRIPHLTVFPVRLILLCPQCSSLRRRRLRIGREWVRHELNVRRGLVEVRRPPVDRCLPAGDDVLTQEGDGIGEVAHRLVAVACQPSRPGHWLPGDRVESTLTIAVHARVVILDLHAQGLREVNDEQVDGRLPLADLAAHGSLASVPVRDQLADCRSDAESTFAVVDERRVEVGVGRHDARVLLRMPRDVLGIEMTHGLLKHGAPLGLRARVGSRVRRTLLQQVERGVARWFAHRVPPSSLLLPLLHPRALVSGVARRPASGDRLRRRIAWSLGLRLSTRCAAATNLCRLPPTPIAGNAGRCGPLGTRRQRSV